MDKNSNNFDMSDISVEYMIENYLEIFEDNSYIGGSFEFVLVGLVVLDISNV